MIFLSVLNNLSDEMKSPQEVTEAHFEFIIIVLTYTWENRLTIILSG